MPLGYAEIAGLIAEGVAAFAFWLDAELSPLLFAVRTLLVTNLGSKGELKCNPLMDANLPSPYNEQIACASIAIQLPAGGRYRECRSI
jgi:hypothetical protein